MLIIHVDYFSSSITQKGRSKIVEEPLTKTIETKEALLVLTSVEKQDEINPEDVSTKAVHELVNISNQLKVNTIVLHSFAHLFGEMSSPDTAIKTLKLIQEGLTEYGLKVMSTPFGWFNTLELKAKGHPLSRIARIITPSEKR
ncbi:threonyl-tRNA synthetase editing domain-containing protein [Candidatus Bathyarchaeota archaeon]|nr:threonyl-tRNA synthetase editing domain-containing protein [Candidatus Bathyarchaeota archaeon]